ncbi:MAG: aminoglycoside phosphotransferase family protein, partial [Desulfovibrionaceae bacterium]
MNQLLSIAQRFGCRGSAPRPDIELPGSPQRCRSRRAVEDADGRIWVLEELAESQAQRRERTSRLLALLGAAGLPVPEFRHAPDGA